MRQETIGQEDEEDKGFLDQTLCRSYGLDLFSSYLKFKGWELGGRGGGSGRDWRD